ncbi:hypothetical protein CI1B_49080 [Bradyrhizobium ivorense]|uniref:XRE family transcriptional regulator n=1 Tax=Bradyrhizobium ivorense TaxID=2511166 RepID=A0A508TE10_9BRAD|nr:hypothetical protein [Bradyrhizobium ivorense]VIO73303.1 hypothetical protein CI1B_49080 [Bradyrhizobium ivorense]
MFPKTGKKFPGDADIGAPTYAALIADVLRSELGNSHRAHKTLMRWTGANERTAKNWLSGSNGPSGEHLLQLMRNSDEVFECVLRLSHRPVVVSNRRLVEVRNSLQGTADLLSEVIDVQCPSRPKTMQAPQTILLNQGRPET